MDIVERLRMRRSPLLDGEREEAAAELTRLRAEVERLQKALLWIDNHDPEIVAAAETKFCFNLAALAPDAKDMGKIRENRSPAVLPSDQSG